MKKKKRKENFNFAHVSGFLSFSFPALLACLKSKDLCAGGGGEVTHCIFKDMTPLIDLSFI